MLSKRLLLPSIPTSFHPFPLSFLKVPKQPAKHLSFSSSLVCTFSSLRTFSSLPMKPKKSFEDLSPQSIYINNKSPNNSMFIIIVPLFCVIMYISYKYIYNDKNDKDKDYETLILSKEISLDALREKFNNSTSSNLTLNDRGVDSTTIENEVDNSNINNKSNEVINTELVENIKPKTNTKENILIADPVSAIIKSSNSQTTNSSLNTNNNVHVVVETSTQLIPVTDNVSEIVETVTPVTSIDSHTLEGNNLLKDNNLNNTNIESETSSKLNDEVVLLNETPSTDEQINSGEVNPTLSTTELVSENIVDTPKVTTSDEDLAVITSKKITVNIPGPEELKIYDSLMATPPEDLETARQLIKFLVGELKVKAYEESLRLSSTVQATVRAEREAAALALEENTGNLYMQVTTEVIPKVKQEKDAEWTAKLYQKDVNHAAETKRLYDEAVTLITNNTETIKKEAHEEIKKVESDLSFKYIQEFDARVGQVALIEQKIKLLETQTDAQLKAQIAMDKVSTLKILLNEINEKLNTEQPFDKQLSTLTSIVYVVDESSEDKFFSSAIPVDFSKSGIPSQKFLTESFKTIESQCLPLALVPADASLFGELSGKLFGYFLKADHSIVGGNSDLAKVSRCGFYLDSGDLESAYNELRSLSGKLKDASLVRQWLEIASARLSVKQTLDALSANANLITYSNSSIKKL